MRFANHQPYRLTQSDYLLLSEHGVFNALEKTELLDGEIFYVNAQHRPHGQVKLRLYDALGPALRGMGSPLSVVVRFSVALSDHDVPEPDLTLTTEPEGKGMVPDATVALLIEVSDTTLDEDLGRKRTLYARAAIPEYWVADVNARVVHQMWMPVGEDFAERRTVPFGQTVTAATVDGLSIETDRL